MCFILFMLMVITWSDIGNTYLRHYSNWSYNVHILFVVACLSIYFWTCSILHILDWKQHWNNATIKKACKNTTDINVIAWSIAFRIIYRVTLKLRFIQSYFISNLTFTYLPICAIMILKEDMDFKKERPMKIIWWLTHWFRILQIHG